MAYEIVLPHDTQTDITEFVETRYIGKVAQLAVTNIIEAEVKKLAANPMLGASIPGGPFETRRIHQFLILLSETDRIAAEFAYSVHKKDGVVVISGFRAVQ